MKKDLQKLLREETGAATAEYAIATMAAVGFAGLLVVIMRSDEVRTILFDLVKSALTFTNPNGDAAPAAPVE
jgi:Flp pilus assembly pilin Flp